MHLKIDENNNVLLSVTIKNTGLAPAFFDLNLIADVTDSSGRRKFQLGGTKRIKKATFIEETENTYVFYSDIKPVCSGDTLCIGLYEDEAAQTPTVKFDNKNTLKNKKLRLGLL